MLCFEIEDVETLADLLRLFHLWHAQTRSANGAPGATGPVSATANLAGVLSESGLLGQVGGTLLGVPLTVGGGVVSAGLNLGSLQGTVVPTGVVQVGQEGASGVVAAGIAPTGGHISASGGFTLGKCSFEKQASEDFLTFLPDLPFSQDLSLVTLLLKVGLENMVHTSKVQL